MQTKNAIKNLKNRYIAVLKKCNLLNKLFSPMRSGLMLASFCACFVLAPSLNAQTLNLTTDDYFIIEPVQSGVNYYSTFNWLENNVTTNYGLLFKNGLNPPTPPTNNPFFGNGLPPTPTYSNPVDLANAMVLQENPNYTIATGSGGLEDFTLNIAGQNLNYTVTAPTTSLGRIAALTTDIDNDVFYGLNSATNGGAIFVTFSNHNLNINGSFINNTSNGLGGAIVLWGSNNNTVNGTFIGNHAVNNGGAIYAQASGNNSMSGIFIGNTSETHGGAIANAFEISVIDGTFIGNSARNFGGAIFNTQSRSIASIDGTFIANRAEQGGAVFNAEPQILPSGVYSSIGPINASFIGNTATTWGGAISNRGVIDSINGLFMENTAGEYGGAINNYASTNTEIASIGSIDASFINNRTTGADGLGGAVWTNRDLTFQANNRINVFSGNMDSTGYNAIYVSDEKHDSLVDLHFNMYGNGGFVFNDSINSNALGFYDMNITGQSHTNNTFYMNNTLSGVKRLSLRNANLVLTADSTFVVGLLNRKMGIGIIQGFNHSEIITTDANNNVIVTPPSTATLTVEAGAKLIIGDTSSYAINGFGDGNRSTSVTVVSGFPLGNATIGEGAWQYENISTDSTLQAAQMSNFPADGEFIVEVFKIFPIHIRTLYNAYPISWETAELFLNFSQVGEDVNSPYVPYALFTRIFDNTDPYYMGTNNHWHTAATVEGLLQLGVSAGTSSNTLNISDSTYENLYSRMNHLLLDNNTNIVYLEDVRNAQLGLPAGSEQHSSRSGLAIWATPFYNYTHTSGLSAGYREYGYDSNLGGLSFGVDYTFPDGKLVGLVINGGGGYLESYGDFNHTTNKFAFSGFSLYGLTQWNTFDIAMDFGYTYAYNDVTQFLPPTLGFPQANALIGTHLITIGAQVLYPYEWQSYDVNAYVGLRYTNIITTPYDVDVNGTTVVHTALDFQNFVSIPAGVTLTRDYSFANGWNISPSYNFGFTVSVGELSTTSRSSIPTVAGRARNDAQSVDILSFNGGIGIEAAKNNMSFALNYDLQASFSEMSHNVFATFVYEF